MATPVRNAYPTTATTSPSPSPASPIWMTSPWQGWIGLRRWLGEKQFYLPIFFGFQFAISLQYLFKLSKRYESISCFCESLNKGEHVEQTSEFICLSVYIFVCFTQFTLLVYKSLIMIVGNFQKYHWIQHTNTQPVVITGK